jgi:hypothetical protein
LEALPGYGKEAQKSGEVGDDVAMMMSASPV